MLGNLRFLLTCALAYLTLPAAAETHPSMAEVLAAAKPADWRPLDQNNTPTFAALIESRRNRPEDFFKMPAGRIDLCNVPIAVRESAPIAPQSP